MRAFILFVCILGVGIASAVTEHHAFTDAISGDWGGKPFEDLRKGWQYAPQHYYEFLDSNKAAALGAAYGGYMINWIEGNWRRV